MTYLHCGAEMSTPYVPYVADIQLDDINNWDEQVSRNIDMEALGFSTPEQRGQLRILLRNAHEPWILPLKSNSQLQQQIATLEKLVDSQRELLQSYKAQLDKIPADAGSGHKASKIPDPPTFSGSDNKMTLEDWLNQVALYCTHNGIATDHQRIVTALARLRSPATTYMKSYYDKVRLGQDLGSWLNFVKELNQIYGKRDDKEGAKDEITALWSNKGLASKDFIKYAEQYRTLARILDYQDGLHIDKLRDVIPQELRNSLVMYEAKSVIFGNGKKGNNSDPNAMEIDEAKKEKNKGKNTQANSQETNKKRYCQICAGKGYKAKSTTHNTNDCWDKPGNEGKKPAFKNSTSNTSLTSGQGNKGGSATQSGKKSFKARLLELLNEDDDGDSPTPPSTTVNVNTASIEEVVDPEPSAKGATAQVNEVQSGPNRLTSQKSQTSSDTLGIWKQSTDRGSC
ncbi:hypothetical protein K435DRAFT_913150 [Dendrothele bispora CBS 962.96]|uniref:Ty3 transposon capsid-like protein domain-containing protein n=1 Tax=Dendrothele bispora (strain CBS 962.96) TaxID=1314807 RepID=A0A4S8LKV3_DENBC|nr:hypothetical protein K435DRAFT_913150 [Dendrothele bispora CBS 962.96]